MGIVEMFRQMVRPSKHQVHVRKANRRRGGRVAHAVVHPAPSKLIKYFAKAAQRGPRGY
jgi:hypothetical protein